MADPQNITSEFFEPQVFQQFVDALEPARGLKLYNSVPKDTTPFPYVQWKVNYGAFSTLAEYNSPNSKANVVQPRPERQSAGNAVLAYMREGEYFTPTATMLLKDSESGNEAAIKPAEQTVANEVKYVNDRLNNRIEYSLWQAVQGGFEYSGNNTGRMEVDYGFRDTHKVVLADNMWDGSTAGKPSVKSMIENIRNAKQTVQRDGGVEVDNVYLTRQTMDLLIDAWTDASTDESNRSLLTDRMIDQYYATGTVTGFMGTGTWEIIDQNYEVEQADGSFKTLSYLPHGTVLFGAFNTNSPLRYTTGPAADFDAPRGHTGRFAKNWKENDPSGRAFLIEEMGLPVLDKPDQFLTMKVAGDTWIEEQNWYS